ncbi:MAG: hypothetical protein LLG37_04845 [Spirochaetia bacterium]|nr:hypothetical protein [Spirochaetia bacterium]
MYLIILLCAGPLFALAALFSRSAKAAALTAGAYAAAHALLCALVYFNGGVVSGYFEADAVNRVFLLILSAVFAGVSVYNYDFSVKSKFDSHKLANYTAVLLLFVSAMTAVLLSSNLGLMWVFIEATTLAGAFLIYFNGTKHALEAVWKYIFICSIGIAFAFAGIIFLSASQPGEEKTLMISAIHAHAGELDKLWLKIAFVLMIVGFGTKAGLAPVHAWLPDAHSEAPSPVSAMLSATLLNSAMLAIIRVYGIMEHAGMEKFASQFLMLMGILSVFVAAVYIMRVGNYKRLLAYSSIENMGIIAAGVSLGQAAMPAVLLQAGGHSLAKAAFFLTSGNILRRYGVKEISGVTGILKKDPVTGRLWIMAFVMISAMPPSPLFFSELAILGRMFASGMWVQAAIIMILLTVIIYGMASVVFKMAFGEPGANAVDERFSMMRYIPQAVFLTALVFGGFLLLAGGLWKVKI